MATFTTLRDGGIDHLGLCSDCKRQRCADPNDRRQRHGTWRPAGPCGNGVTSSAEPSHYKTHNARPAASLPRTRLRDHEVVVALPPARGAIGRAQSYVTDDATSVATRTAACSISASLPLAKPKRNPRLYDRETYAGRTILVRYVFDDITARSCRFVRSFSADNGKTWERNMVALFTRTESP